MWILLVGSFLFSTCAGESLYADIVANMRHRRLTQLPHQYPPQAQPRPQQHATPVQPISYRPYSEAPERIKQLLVLQQYREPIVHIQAGPAPKLHQVPLASAPQPQPAQYAPKIQYGHVPPQPAYKPIQPVQQPAYKPIQPLHQSPYKGILAQSPRVPVKPPQNNYTPQYKTSYPQQPAGPNALYRPALIGAPPAGLAQYQAQPQFNRYPKGLPSHIQKIIDSQRSYQG